MEINPQLEFAFNRLQAVDAASSFYYSPQLAGTREASNECVWSMACDMKLENHKKSRREMAHLSVNLSLNYFNF